MAKLATKTAAFPFKHKLRSKKTHHCVLAPSLQVGNPEQRSDLEKFPWPQIFLNEVELREDDEEPALLFGLFYKGQGVDQVNP